MGKLQLKDLTRDKCVKPTVLKMFWTCYSEATASCSELGAVSSQMRQFKGYWVAFYVALQRNEIPSGRTGLQKEGCNAM